MPTEPLLPRDKEIENLALRIRCFILHDVDFNNSLKEMGLGTTLSKNCSETWAERLINDGYRKANPEPAKEPLERNE